MAWAGTVRLRASRRKNPDAAALEESGHLGHPEAQECSATCRRIALVGAAVSWARLPKKQPPRQSLWRIVAAASSKIRCTAPIGSYSLAAANCRPALAQAARHGRARPSPAPPWMGSSGRGCAFLMPAAAATASMLHPIEAAREEEALGGVQDALAAGGIGTRGHTDQPDGHVRPGRRPLVNSPAMQYSGPPRGGTDHPVRRKAPRPRPPDHPLHRGRRHRPRHLARLRSASSTRRSRRPTAASARSPGTRCSPARRPSTRPATGCPTRPSTPSASTWSASRARSPRRSAAASARSTSRCARCSTSTSACAPCAGSRACRAR